MEGEMRTDVDVLLALTNEAPLVTDRVTGRGVTLSRKQIAHWTGLAVQTISDYALGKTNIPVDFWRRILEHHLDERIVRLLIPDSCEAEVHPRSIELTDPVASRETLAVEKAHHDKQSKIADILADGRVDELDASTVRDYDDAYADHRIRDSCLHRAVMVAWNRHARVTELSR